MLGKLAIERTNTQEAVFQFQLLYDIAEELGDVDLFARALIHQAEMLRRRGRYEASLRRMDAAARYIENAPKNQNQNVSPWIQGALWKASAITAFTYGDEQTFLRSIDQARTVVENIRTNDIDTLNNDIDLVEILQTEAQGYTMLWKPEKAIEIYRKTDTLRPFRPLRDQSSYHIVKAQAYCALGDVQDGIVHAEKGLRMAETLGSARYITRLKQMSDRLSLTPLGKERALINLRKEVEASLQRMNS
jgi:tetratricopeptide (TPR) repeat protein